jgi:bifunctional isochorismate lyase/aryl carrier protein
VLTKHRYSAFQRSNLETLMRARGRDQLVICGVYAHIGCMATAVEAFQRDIEAFFVADALADYSREKHDMALQWVAATCGVPLMTAQVTQGAVQGAAS